MHARDKNRQTNKTMAETKITYEQHFGTLDKAEKMSELQDISIEFQKTEGEQRPKKEKKRKKKRISMGHGATTKEITYAITYILGMPEGKQTNI